MIDETPYAPAGQGRSFDEKVKSRRRLSGENERDETRRPGAEQTRLAQYSARVVRQGVKSEKAYHLRAWLLGHVAAETHFLDFEYRQRSIPALCSKPAEATIDSTAASKRRPSPPHMRFASLSLSR